MSKKKSPPPDPKPCKTCRMAEVACTGLQQRGGKPCCGWCNHG
jgi:hypothetical protein